MRYITLATMVVALALTGPAYASGGHILSPSFNDSWTAGNATFTVTNSACSANCSWRAVAASLPALYPCPDEPYLGPAQIAWESADLRYPGTVSASVQGFAGPAGRARLCLYLDRRDAEDADHYLLVGDTRFDQQSGPAETFEPLIADPAGKVVQSKRKRNRHHHARKARRGTVA